MDVQLPDGRVLRGVPDGTTKAQLAQRLQTNGFQVPQEWFGQPAAPAISDQEFADYARLTGFGGTREELQRQMAEDAARPKQSTLSKMGSAAGGGAELLLHGATGIAGGLGGGLNYLATLAASGGDTQAAKAVQEGTQEALTYQPRSQAGKSLAYGLGKAMEVPGAIGEMAAEPTRRALTAVGANPQTAAGIATAIRVAPDAAVQALGLRGMRGGKAAITEAAAAPKVVAPTKVATTPTEVARTLGLKVNPSDVPGARVGGLIEGGSGSAKLKTRLSQENAPVITSHVREELGLPPGPKLTAQELEAAKAPHNAKYAAVAETMPAVDVDAAFNTALNKAGDKWRAIIQLPGVAKLKKQFAELGNLKTEQVMKQIAILRESGFNDLTTAAIKTTPNRTALKAKGSAQVDIANAFEQLIDRNALAKGFGDLVPELQQARVGLAKISSAKRALINDDVSAVSLMKQADRGVPLSGRLKAIADVAKAHPDVVRDVSKVKNKSPIGVLDVALPGSVAIATGQPLVAAGVLARPAARSFVASETYQNRLGRPAAPGQIKQALPQYFPIRKQTPRQQAQPVKRAPQEQAPLDLQRPIFEPPPGAIGPRPAAPVPAPVENQVPLDLNRAVLEPPPGRVGAPPSAAARPRIVPGRLPGYFKIETPGETTAVEIQGRAKAEALLRDLPSNVTPINKYGDITFSAPDELGQFTANSKNGETIVQKVGDALQVVYSKTEKGAQGTGEGLARIKALVKKAEAEGLKFWSDINVAPAAANIYAKLEKQGYKIKRNPVKFDSKGNLVSIDSTKPVFEIAPRRAAQ